MKNTTSGAITIGTFSDGKDGAWRFSVIDGDLAVESWKISKNPAEGHIIYPITRIPLESFRKAPERG